MNSPEKKLDDDEDKKSLETQDSTDGSSQLSVTSSAFTEDSLNTNSGSDKYNKITNKTVPRQDSTEDEDNTKVRTGESEETSDTETEQVNTAVHVHSPASDQVHSPTSDQVISPASDHSSERERQEDLEVFGLRSDMYTNYEDDHDDEDEFFFDSDLNLETHIDDQMVAAELLRPERLDTVEEVSEPVSDSVNSLPHDGVRWPEQIR